MKRLIAAILPLALAACASAPRKPASESVALPDRDRVHSSGLPTAGGRKKSPYAPAQEDASKRGNYTAGGLYAPGVRDSTPDYVPNVDAIPEPDVVAEPRSRFGNRSPYSVLGKTYRVLDNHDDYVETGTASYYGQKFHGRRTSNLEVYDMYAFTAAHKSLPLPSFARVTNLDNGKSVVVRVNDRGPFHDGRVIDLSYAAAVKLGITQRGTGRVEVRALHPGEDAPPVLAAAPKPPEAKPTESKQADTAPSAMDRLVSAMPIASAQAGELPPGVRVATGKPAPVAAKSAAAAPKAGTGGDYRFDMMQNGKTMSADEFEAWMKARQVRVATGKAAPAAAAPARKLSRAERRALEQQRKAEATAALPAPAKAPPPPSPAKAATEVAAAIERSPAARDGDVTLQVASFSARSNADRALGMLKDAGIGDARLLDGNANGQKVWRLRVGPLQAERAPELAARIVGLGFGQPQRVRD
ncbi:septal ring lytic transglycosylase RlpA family protein [Lysobacter silvisoli]|uniref:Endolytic peptidoglycan transglycosylase RlpA n=1 Tax=Lysobacter silvisoli TaxID=2293254 RepID=A0A371K0C6_9GAMM|nr:septal ring lytic transglycosylase RlpA family protein [Lysobacter silvisoli]RDZ27344.1 septal ring lytic transglycosylase RlpA family protein [Lysobacter silvisoli]